MKYRLTRPAIRDLAEIGRYGMNRWGEQQAKRYAKSMAARMQWLCVNKALWHPREDVHEGVYCYREQSHMLWFREYPSGIEILRVLHVRMDPARHLTGEN
ncbi:MAG: type II toxin-antitoxin system RelE/ParE family toxin [Gammaproteobacteria bacterium]